MKYLQKNGRQGNSTTYCSDTATQNTIDRCILLFPKKSDLKNYRAILYFKIYNALLLNRSEHEIEKILKKNQNGFRRNRSTTSQILIIHQILDGVRAKILKATLL